MTATNPIPEEVVLDFFARWSRSIDDIYASVREFMSEDAVWENVGMSTTTGPEEAVGVLTAFMSQMDNPHHMDVEMLSVATCGNTVLTERRDIIIAGDGTILLDIPVMGALEVRDGKINAWRDYFDTARFVS